MKKCWREGVFIGVSILVVCITVLALRPAPQKVRVGTFDSRAIGMAYARSAMIASVEKEWKDKYEKAKAEKNEAIIKECEAWRPTYHKLQMLQVFSLASVVDILEKVKDNLPTIAQEAGVDMIVSQWEVAYRNPSIETVDVTSYLVKIFNPDELTLKYIEELSEQPPLPLLEVLLSKEE